VIKLWLEGEWKRAAPANRNRVLLGPYTTHYESAATHANVTECVRGRRTPNDLGMSKKTWVPV